MTTKFLLIRHGQIRANSTKRWHGATDSPLTATGARQAQRLAARLRDELPQLDAIYASPMQRCFDTATVLAGLLAQPVVPMADLREYDIGELEGTRFRVLDERHGFFRRILEDPDYAPPGGESMNLVAKRMQRALQQIAAQHPASGHVAIVSHGAAMAIALAQLLHQDPRHWTNYRIANCSITELQLQPDPLVLTFNRTEHL